MQAVLRGSVLLADWQRRTVKRAAERQVPADGSVAAAVPAVQIAAVSASAAAALPRRLLLRLPRVPSASSAAPDCLHISAKPVPADCPLHYSVH